jgi:ribosomal protein S18 acetylase RimI-like enzyme
VFESRHSDQHPHPPPGAPRMAMAVRPQAEDAGSGYSLRTLHPDDLDAVSRVHWRACRLAYRFMDWAYGLDEVRAWYGSRSRSWDCGLVACQDGTVVAYLAASGAHIDQLFVDPDHQCRGLGSLLLGAMLERRLRPATLVVHAANGPARRLYGRFGFRPTGGWWDERDRALKLHYRLE